MPEEPEEYDIYYSKFAVGDKPYCVWEHDLAERNLEYLESLDPAYFEYVAEVNGAQLDATDSSARRHAAVAIRFAYHHGLETLFALLFAALQAPDCVVGWMQRYDTESLRNLVRSVDEQRFRYLKVKPRPYTWEGISAKIMPASAGDDETITRVQELFGNLWRRFAGEFLDQNQINEYNSIKHGLRTGTQASGFYLSIGAEDTPGEPAPAGRMHSMGGSEFGSSFFMAGRFGPQVQRPRRSEMHFRVRRCALNWDPESLCAALSLISFSIHNVLTFLKATAGGDRSSLEFKVPQSDDDFQAPWQRTSGVSFSNLDDIVFKENIQTFSREEILAVYAEEAGDETSRRP